MDHHLDGEAAEGGPNSRNGYGRRTLLTEDGKLPISVPRDPAPVVVAMVIDVLTALSSASAKGAQRRLADRERLAQELHLYL